MIAASAASMTRPSTARSTFPRGAIFFIRASKVTRRRIITHGVTLCLDSATQGASLPYHVCSVLERKPGTSIYEDGNPDVKNAHASALYRRARAAGRHLRPGRGHR